jgi:hypothetical protein
MVHALEEIHRVLAPGGVLLDLRPLADRWPVEIVQGDNVHETGHLIDLPNGLADDLASNHAVEKSAQRGWFKRKSDIIFPFYIYWEDPNEMKEYITDRWADFVELSDLVQIATQSVWISLGTGKRVRIKLKMLLTNWQTQ